MARWRLTDAHYLAVPGIEWEYRETNRETGRQARKVYDVPIHLDPKNQADWNYPSDEAIIVSNRFDAAHPRDHVFIGPPTPDMEPLDDEAKKISDRERPKWVHPIESLNMTYSESMLSNFERQIAEIVAKSGSVTSSQVKATSLSGVDAETFERLQQQVATLMEKNAQLEEHMTKVKQGVRRL